MFALAGLLEEKSRSFDCGSGGFGEERDYCFAFAQDDRF